MRKISDHDYDFNEKKNSHVKNKKVKYTYKAP